MRKLILGLIMVSFGLGLNAQIASVSWKDALKTKKAKITVMYYENFPFTYTDKLKNVRGLEADILQRFVEWCYDKKGVDIELEYQRYNSFAGFYDKMKTLDNGAVGLGSVAVTPERKTEVQFTAPYMKNKSILVSHLGVPNARLFEDFEKVFGEMTALVIQGSSHEKEMMEIKKLHHPKMRVKYMDSPSELLQLIFENKDYYGYVDLISYWAFVQERCCVMKIHRDVSLKPEYFAFMLPKQSDWGMAFSEFFEGGFGFTATEEYREILELYLGYEVIHSVELY